MSRARRHPTFVFLLLLLVALAAPGAVAGTDDLEFARQLARIGREHYARQIYEAILADDTRSEEVKDGAWYGLALLAKERALRLASDPDSTLDEIVRAFERAVQDVEEFAEEQPENRNADQARLDAGTIRLAFVQWAYENQDQPDWCHERGFDFGTLAEAVRRMATDARRHFAALRVHEKGAKPTSMQALASYYYVVTGYYRALAEPPCAPTQMAALESAGADLEAYIMSHDGQLLAVYAQDLYGLVWWEKGKCEEDPKRRLVQYGKAAEWFETCLFTEGSGPDFLRIIARGYLHLARMAVDAARIEERDFPAEARKHLEQMLKRNPAIGGTENGIRALLAWAELERSQGRTTKAITITKDAADRAKKAGFAYLARRAKRALADLVLHGGNGRLERDPQPDTLIRVAEDQFLSGEYRMAIRTFRRVILATPDTPKAFLEYRWEAWKRIAQSYKQLGDRLGEALAYESIHDAWMRGWIPHREGHHDDPNMDKAGYERRYAEQAIKELAERTRSPVFQRFYQGIRDGFIKDYPYPTPIICFPWNAAIDKWKLGTDQKDANDGRWKDTLRKALPLFEIVAKQAEARFQDLAWAYMVRTRFELDQLHLALKTAQEAWALWETPEAKSREEKSATVRQRRVEAKSALAVWQARCLEALGRHEEVIELLADYHTRWPQARSPYPSMAYDYLIQAHLALGDPQAAEPAYRKLLESDPKYFNLRRLTLLMAEAYSLRGREEEGGDPGRR